MIEPRHDTTVSCESLRRPHRERRPRYRAVRALALVLVGAAALAAYEPLVAAEPPRDYVETTAWAELEPMFPQDEFPISRDEARRRMLAEAQWVLSGMVYGFRFHYVPSDSARAVSEQFGLEPVAEIVSGDPRLNVREVWLEESVLHTKVDYRLRDFQRSRLEAWYSSAVPEVGGSGEAEMWDGPSAKRDAVSNAVKSAVREHLRGMTHNKPRETVGTVLFVDTPRVRVEAGAYLAGVRIRVRVQEIRDYEIF